MGKDPFIRVNRQIRVPEVRVIDGEGAQLGVMPTSKALELAGEKGLDLVEVSPDARPPVCRIMDFGKFKYERSKKLRQSKKKQHTIHLKEIKLRPKTEEHDYQFKKRHAEEFLEKHHKVKFTVMFRGRELNHKEMGQRILDRMAEELSHVGVIERPAKFEGRFMIMIMAPEARRTVEKQPQGAEQPKKAAASKENRTPEKDDQNAETQDK